MPNESSRITSFSAAVVLLTVLCGVFQKLPAQIKDASQQPNLGIEAMKMADTPRGFYCIPARGQYSSRLTSGRKRLRVCCRRATGMRSSSAS